MRITSSSIFIVVCVAPAFNYKAKKKLIFHDTLLFLGNNIIKT